MFLLFGWGLETGGRWPYNCFVGCCFQDLFHIARSNLVQFPPSLFSVRLINIHVVHPYSRIDTTDACKKLCFILLDKSDFRMIDKLSIAVHDFAMRILMSFSVDVTLLPRCVNLFANFREPPFSVWRCLLFYLNTCTPFCLHSHEGQCDPLPTPYYAVGIRLGLVNLQEALSFVSSAFVIVCAEYGLLHAFVERMFV